MTSPDTLPRTLGELRASGHRERGVKDEIRENLLAALAQGDDVWPGIFGFEDTVLPQLERALIGKIEDFLRTLGGMFAFMGSQYRLEVDGREFFIDLLLFHRRLRCLVAIELKVGEFQPEFVGKMQFYLAALDRQVRQPDENSSIGIILCKEKSRTIVEYALHDANKPIGVATYEITQTLPRDLAGQLPSPEAIAALLEGIEQ